MTRPTTEDLERLADGAPPKGRDYDETITTLAREVLALRKKLAAAEKVVEALTWYRGNVSWCNNFGPEGVTARDRLAKDLGEKAQTALTEWENTND